MDSGSHIESLILPRAGSDHWAVALQMDLGEPPRYKPFRFEKFWLAHPDFNRLASSWWEQAAIDHGTCMYRFQQRLKNFKQRLKHWNKNSFGNICKAYTSEQNAALTSAHHPRGGRPSSKIHASRKAPGPDGFTTDFFPPLLGSDPKECMGSS
jgi:hypothetical protein